MNEKPPGKHILDIPPRIVSAFGDFVLQAVRQWANTKSIDGVFCLHGIGLPRRYPVCPPIQEEVSVGCYQTVMCEVCSGKFNPKDAATHVRVTGHNSWTLLSEVDYGDSNS